MSFNRLIFAAIITTSLAVGVTDPAQNALILMGVYKFLALCILIHIVIYPVVSPARRLFALLLDSVFLSAQLHLGGETAAAFFPIYLWVTLGNGFRFGLAWLRLAMLVTTISFAAVILTTPFWAEQGHLSAGLLISLLILPAYAGTLIGRLSKALKQAEHASEAKTLFLASVSHELRTPLTAIIGMGGMLRETRLDPSQKEMAETIQDAGASLLSLISSILDSAQAEAGHIPVEPEAIDLLALLRETCSLVAAQAHVKGLTVALHVDARTPVQIIGSRRNLSDILVNLAANAVKFTESGSVIIAVDAEPPVDATTQLTVRVIDSGIGIPADAQGRIFESFTQADQTIRHRYGGTGLGLSIARRRAELMGGSLVVRSVEGQGAEFTLRLGVGVPAAAAERPDARPASIVIAGPLSPRRDQIAEGLAKSGAVVITVPEALRMLRNDAAGADQLGRSFALVVVDDPRSTEFALPADAVALHDQISALPCVMLRAADRTGLNHLAWPVPAVLLSSGSEADVRAALCLARITTRGSANQGAEGVITPLATPRHVLIADDNLVNRRVLSKMLETAGHTVTTVVDGEVALDALENAVEGFDLVLMDVNMPGMDGLEATKLYRFMELGKSRLPIVGLTADATPEMAQRCLDAGMDLCVTKPVSPEALLNSGGAAYPQRR